MVHIGHEVTVFTTTANGKDELNVEIGKKHDVHGVHVYYFKRLTGDHTHWSPSLTRELKQKGNSFDIIHIQAWWNLVSVMAARICIAKRFPVVLSLRGTLSEFSLAHSKSIIKKMFHQLAGKKILKKLMLHATSRKELNDVKNLLEKDEIKLLPNIPELPEKVYPHADSDIFRMIFIGRIHPVKNVDWLIRTVSQLDIDYSLTIIGSGEEAYVNDLQRISCINPHISWTGEMDGPEKYKYLANADLLLLPSQTENFGNVIFESLSQGTAVLLSDQVGGKDYITYHKAGWALPLDSTLWVNSIQNIASDRESLNVIRQKMPGQLRQDFDQDTLAKEYVQMYQDARFGSA